MRLLLYNEKYEMKSGRINRTESQSSPLYHDYELLHFTFNSQPSMHQCYHHGMEEYIMEFLKYRCQQRCGGGG